MWSCNWASYSHHDRYSECDIKWWKWHINAGIIVEKYTEMYPLNKARGLGLGFYGIGTNYLLKNNTSPHIIETNN